MFSMTGFGKGSAVMANGWTVTAELSSVNRKQLEIRLSLPPELSALDPAIRKWVGSAVSRGAIQLKLACIAAEKMNSNSINQELLTELISAAAAARKAAGLSGEVAVETLFSVPGVVCTALPSGSEEEYAEAARQAIEVAIGSFNAMRHTEGEALKKDFLQRIEMLEKLLLQIEPLVAGLEKEFKARLMEKLSDAELKLDPNDDRLLKEVLFYADKADVTEEITRLKSHFRQFRNFADSAEPMGRNLDFLLQEFFREITTLGNKAGVPEVSPLVVNFKSELEKLREQIQNVE